MRGLNTIPALLVILCLLAGPARSALDCARCHQNPAMAPSVKDRFGESGTSRDIKEHFGLNARAVAEAVKAALAAKPAPDKKGAQ